MKNLSTIIEIFNLISCVCENNLIRRRALGIRKSYLKEQSTSLVKLAFDTRRIDQENEYNPRRNLQNYNRSEAFVSEALAQKIQNFTKLKEALYELKKEYGKENEWHDSNARILLSNLENGLRTNQQDGDFTMNQPSLGSLDYIEQLLHVRYRLGFDELTKLGVDELKKIVLSKDEDLKYKNVYKDFEITKTNISSQSYDFLINKLFSDCRATSENPTIERSITITIKDSIINKNGVQNITSKEGSNGGT